MFTNFTPKCKLKNVPRLCMTGLTFFFPFIILMWKSCSSIQTRISGKTEPRIGGRTDLPLNFAVASEFFTPERSQGKLNHWRFFVCSNHFLFWCSLRGNVSNICANLSTMLFSSITFCFPVSIINNYYYREASVHYTMMTKRTMYD